MCIRDRFCAACTVPRVYGRVLHVIICIPIWLSVGRNIFQYFSKSVDPVDHECLDYFNSIAAWSVPCTHRLTSCLLRVLVPSSHRFARSHAVCNISTVLEIFVLVLYILETPIDMVLDFWKSCDSFFFRGSCSFEQFPHVADFFLRYYRYIRSENLR